MLACLKVRSSDESACYERRYLRKKRHTLDTYAYNAAVINRVDVACSVGGVQAGKVLSRCTP